MLSRFEGFGDTIEQSGSSRELGHATVANAGEANSRQHALGEAAGGAEEEAKRAFGWDKRWWPARAWFLWAITGPTVMVLLFSLACLSQGWQCGLVYVAIMLPMDVLSFYFDLFAYDDGGLFWLELTVAVLLNVVLCMCLMPAYAVHQLSQEDKAGYSGAHRLPARGYNTGFLPDRGIYQAGAGREDSAQTLQPTGAGFRPFHGQGQSTGYGQVNERTKLV